MPFKSFPSSGLTYPHLHGYGKEDQFPKLINCYCVILTDANTFDKSRTCLYTFPSMKKDIHPANYRPVVFQDINNNTTFLTRSTAATEETIKLDGVEYPLVKVHISSASHPFFTGEEKIVDVEGRVDKFKARAAAGQASREKRSHAAKKQTARKEAKQAKQEAKAKPKTEKSVSEEE